MGCEDYRKKLEKVLFVKSWYRFSQGYPKSEAHSDLTLNVAAPRAKMDDVKCTEAGTTASFSDSAATGTHGQVSQMKAGDTDVSPDRHSTPVTTTEMKTPANTTTLQLIEDLLRVKKKRRPSGIVVVADDEGATGRADNTPSVKRTCRRRADSDGVQEPEAVLLRSVDSADVSKGSVAPASDKLSGHRAVRPTGASLGAVPLPDVVASGDAGGWAGLPRSAARGRDAVNRTTRGTAGFHALDPARHFLALDAALARYGCTTCDIAYNWMHVFNNHWMQNHGQVANSGQIPVFMEPRNFPLNHPILVGYPVVPQPLPAHIIGRENPRIGLFQILSCGPLNASLDSRNPRPGGWNCASAGDVSTTNAMKANVPERRASGAHLSSASSGALDLSQPYLAPNPPDHVLDLSTGMQVVALDLCVQKPDARLGPAVDAASIAVPPEDRQDTTADTTDKSDTSLEKDCSLRTTADSEVVEITALTSEMGFFPAKKLTDVKFHEGQEHSKDEDWPESQNLDSRFAEDINSSEDPTADRGTEFTETVTHSADERPEEPTGDNASRDKGRPYSCSLCKAAYKLKWHLEKHLKKFHRAFWRSQRQVKLSPSSESSVCFESTNNTSPAVPGPGLNLKGDAQAMTARCPCGYASKWKGNLVKHMKKCTSAVKNKKDNCIKQSLASSGAMNSSVASNKQAALTGTVIAAVSNLLAETLSLSSYSETLPTPSFASSERRASIANELKCEWCDMTCTQVTSLYRHAQNSHALQLRKQEMEEALNLIPFTTLSQDEASESSPQQQPGAQCSGKSLSGSENAGLTESKSGAGMTSLKQQAVDSSLTRFSLDRETSNMPPPLLSGQQSEFPELTASSADSQHTHRPRRPRGRGWSIIDGGFVPDTARRPASQLTSPKYKYKCVTCNFGTWQRSAMFQHSCKGLEIAVAPGETIAAFAAGQPEEIFVAGKTARHAEPGLACLPGFPEQVTDTGNTVGKEEITGQTSDSRETSISDMTT